MPKNQVRILNLFRKNIFLKATILEIMHLLKNKSYQRIYESIRELERKNMVELTSIGNSQLCELRLSLETISTISFLEEQEALSRKIPCIKEMLEFKEFKEDIILITGSYAKGNQTPKSDIDLVIITRDDAYHKQKLIENMTALFKPAIHPVVISQEDFMSMLLEKKESYGKEMFKSKLLFRGSTRYFELIKEAKEHGFNG